MNKIHINQLGYRPNDKKRVVVPKEALEFKIVRIFDKAVVYSAQTDKAVIDIASKDTVRTADFSLLTETGEFFIKTEDSISYPFVISETPYSKLRRALLEMFNYQKCGVELDCGLWSHPACHTSPATVYGTKKTKDVSGGWHDAGDYGRYIVPAAKSVADLLLAHELSPNPDSDLLDIAWFEIEWMLKMQDKESGGVYHKVSCKKFNALDEMPHDEKDELILLPISSAATADFAASIALASRFYPQKKDVLLKAALAAWNWCEANPQSESFVNPPDIRTGQYGDDNDKDERLWAACELFAASADTSGEKKFLDYIKKEINAGHVYAPLSFIPEGRRLLSGLGWGNVGTYAILAYLNAKKDGGSQITEHLKKELLSDCQAIINRYKESPYGISLGENFPWGSNMTVANNAMTLLLGRHFVLEDSDRKKTFTEAALEHFHYLLGKNPLSQSYVTGFGAQGVRNPHHRPSVAKGSAVPGMLAGGPCGKIDRDPVINAYCKDAPPSKRYVDHTGSFASNEITIYWNSPLYFITAFLGM